MYCNACGKNIGEDGRYCSHCGNVVGTAPVPKKLMRSRVDRKVGGVCAGLAHVSRPRRLAGAHTVVLHHAGMRNFSGRRRLHAGDGSSFRRKPLLLPVAGRSTRDELVHQEETGASPVRR